MRLLLDLHIFLWIESAPEKLSEKALAACNDRSAELLLSVASVWEMVIKVHLGKLRLLRSIEEMIRRQEEENDLRVLPIELTHVLALRNLPALHRDPFDRLLVSQASVERCAIVSADRALFDYPVEVIW